MNRKKIVFGIVVVAALLVVAGLVVASMRDQKVRACPDAWIDNRMPGGNTEPSGEYFIYDEKRKEASEVDVTWVQNNCSIKEPVVVQ